MKIDLSTVPTWALVLFAVLAVVQLTLDVVAILDLYRRPTKQVTFENKWIWVVIILLVNIIGPILYLATGRRPAPGAEDTVPAAPSVGIEEVADTLYGPDKDAEQR